MRYESLKSMVSISETVREPARDIAAQLAALRDSAHPKRTVFVAAPDDPPWHLVPAHAWVVSRESGILLTTDRAVFEWFNGLPNPSDTDLARALGYPESKGCVIEAGKGHVVQARNGEDCVIFEALCTDEGRTATIRAAAEQVPVNGRVMVTDIRTALNRRLAEL